MINASELLIALKRLNDQKTFVCRVVVAEEAEERGLESDLE